MERRGSRWSRRQVVLGAGAASVGLLAGCGRLPWQGQPQSQQAAIVRRIGFLSEATGPASDSFRQGLREHGYVDGQNVTLVWGLAEGQDERYPVLAQELV